MFSSLRLKCNLYDIIAHTVICLEWEKYVQEKKLIRQSVKSDTIRESNQASGVRKAHYA